jgi:hypothetical protein
MVAGAVFVLAWLYFSTGGGAYVIQVDYTWGGEFLDSAQVMIGDSVLGRLLPRAGGQRISGFEVEPGEYEVRVEKESCEGIPRTVALRDGESRRAVLMADIDDGYNCRIRLW